MLEDRLDQLATAYRVLSYCGHDDLTLGHLALRDPDARGLWIKSSQTGMRELNSRADFQLLSFDGALLAGSGEKHSEWPIHAEVFQARPEVNVSVHTHSEWPTMLSTLSMPLRAVTTAAAYLGPVPVADFPVAHIDNRPTARELATQLGRCRAILLKNHGVVFVGRSIEQATVVGYYLVRAAWADIQLRAIGETASSATVGSLADRALMIESDKWLSSTFACLAGRYSSSNK